MRDNQNINDLNYEQSWGKAEKMLDKHFRKRKIIIWSVSLFIVGLVIITSSVFIGKSSKENSSAPQTVASEHPVNLEAEKKQPEIIPSPEKEIVYVKADDSPQKRIVHSGVKTVDDKLFRNKIENKKPVHETPAFVSKEVVSVHQKNIVPGSENVAVNLHPEETRSKTTERKDAEENTVVNNSVVPQQDAKVKEDRSPSSSLPELALIDPIRISNIPVAHAGDLIPVSKDETGPLTLPKKKFDLKFSAYAGVHAVSKNLMSDQFSDYVDRRKNEEEGIVTASMGVSLAHAVKDFSVSVGFEYSAWGEKNLYLPYLNKKSAVENGYYHDFTTIDVDTLYIWGNQWFIYDTIPDSTFISHVDTVTKSEYDASVYGANNVNRYYFFEVPVELSYRFTHSKLSIGATVGISPAWLITKKGYYLNKDLSGIELISDMKSINTFIVNGRFSLDLYYEMSKRFNILLRPQLKANLNSFFKGDYGVSQRYYATGLIFGLQYAIQ